MQKSLDSKVKSLPTADSSVFPDHSFSESPTSNSRIFERIGQAAFVAIFTALLVKKVNDYAQPKISFAEKVFNSRSRPWILEGQKDLPAVTLFGGLAGAPKVWKAAGRAVNDTFGFRIEGYGLAGHDGPAKSLHAITANDWIKGVYSAVKRNYEMTGPVIIGGFSTSTLPALIVAAEHPEMVAGLLLAGMPYDFKNATHRRVVRVLEHIDNRLPYGRALLNKVSLPLFLAKGEGANSNGIPMLPLSSLANLSNLQRRVVPALLNIQCPILALLGTNDPYSDSKGLERFKNALPDRVKEKTQTVLVSSNHYPFDGKAGALTFHNEVIPWLANNFLPINAEATLGLSL